VLQKTVLSTFLTSHAVQHFPICRTNFQHLQRECMQLNCTIDSSVFLHF